MTIMGFIDYNNRDRENPATSSPGPFVILGEETKRFRLHLSMTKGPEDEVKTGVQFLKNSSRDTIILRS